MDFVWHPKWNLNKQIQHHRHRRHKLRRHPFPPPNLPSPFNRLPRRQKRLPSLDPYGSYDLTNYIWLHYHVLPKGIFLLHRWELCFPNYPCLCCTCDFEFDDDSVLELCPVGCGGKYVADCIWNNVEFRECIWVSLAADCRVDYWCVSDWSADRLLLGNCFPNRTDIHQLFIYNCLIPIRKEIWLCSKTGILRGGSKQDLRWELKIK